MRRTPVEEKSHFFNIFKARKMRTAPPKPPPNRRYKSDQPAAANIGVNIKAIISDE